MQECEVNTVAVFLIGPFVDKGDGVTPETGITLAGADSAEVMKHNGTTFVDIAAGGGNQATLTHKEQGMYTISVPAAVISDEGRMTIFISDESVCLPVWKDVMVLSQAAWASKYDARDTGSMAVDLTAGAVDDIWDEVITGAAHNDATSAGRRLRTAGHDEEIMRESTCQAGEDSSHVKLDNSASSTNNFYDHSWILLKTGTGAGQIRLLDDYVGSSKVGEVHPDWQTSPDGTSTFIIFARAVTMTHDIEAEGLASINAEVSDVLKTDTISELSQGVPAATPTFETALMLVYMALRNKLTTTSTELGIYNDSGTKIAKKVLSDDGTTYTEDEAVSGA